MVEIVYATVVKVYAEKGVNYLNVNRDDNGIIISDVAILTWMAGPKYGAVYVPTVGQQVVIGILNPVTQQAVCFGCLYNETNVPPMKVKPTNTCMCITYGTGWNLMVESQKGKEKLTFQTAKGDEISIDQAGRKFLIKSSDGNNKVEMNCTAGTLKVSALKEISMSVGANNSIKMNSQGVKINGALFVNIGATNLALQAKSQAKLQGTTAIVNGNAQVKVTGAIAALQGNGMTKIG